MRPAKIVDVQHDLDDAIFNYCIEVYLKLINFCVFHDKNEHIEDYRNQLIEIIKAAQSFSKKFLSGNSEYETSRSTILSSMSSDNNAETEIVFEFADNLTSQVQQDRDELLNGSAKKILFYSKNSLPQTFFYSSSSSSAPPQNPNIGEECKNNAILKAAAM
jgi:hypothetical protein